MSGRERQRPWWRCLYALAAAAVAQPALGVGLIQSFNLQIEQGGNTLFSGAVITDSTAKRDGSTALYLGDATNGTEVWATVKVDLPAQAQEPDRNFYLTINGKDGGSIGSLFNHGPASEDGLINIRLTDMVFSDVDAINRVEPFDTEDYDVPGLQGLPLLYMLNHDEGFITLPGGIRYADNIGPWFIDWPSVQVPKDTWTDYYSFAILNSGWNTGFELTDISDVSGVGPGHTGAQDITRIDPDPGPPYFIDPNVPQLSPGLVDEIGIVLNMRDVTVPEPAAAVMLLAPLALWARRRRR